MDDTSPPGLFDLIQQRQGSQQQQAPQGGGGLFGGMGGLLGAIDPQKMAYLGMIAKGLDPYSSIDPTAMLKNAQLAQQHQLDLAQRQSQSLDDFSLRQRHQQLLEDQAAKDKWKLQDFGTDPLSGQKDLRWINTQTNEIRPASQTGSAGQDSGGGGQGTGGLGKVPETYKESGKDGLPKGS
jgi:hypothetical protein